MTLCTILPKPSNRYHSFDNLPEVEHASQDMSFTSDKATTHGSMHSEEGD